MLSQEVAQLNWTSLALLVAITSILGSFYLCAKPILFGLLFAGALMFNNFLVNPIAQGLPILLESTAAQHLAALHAADPKALWAAYDRNTLAQFGTAQGARFLNGLKTVPDLKLLGQLDASPVSRAIYNRYAFITLNLPPAGETRVHFRPLGKMTDGYRLFVRPDHPALQAAGLRYAVFPRILNAGERGTMRLIDALPANLIYIYRVTPLSAPAATLPVR
ncbi:MAG: DUF7654 domain-containing protein [Chthoniobacterales bacterium]